MGRTLEEAENWKDDVDEIALQFKHLMNLSVFFDDEWLERRKKDLYDQLSDTWEYGDIVIFEDRGFGMSNFNSDQYINHLMKQNGYSGEKVGLGYC